MASVRFAKLRTASVLLLFAESKKNPEVIKKNGTASRATTLVRTKSPVSLNELNGDVWIATTRNAATIRAISIPT